MPINFTNNTVIGGVTNGSANTINIPGSVVQVVDNTQTVSGSATTGAWVNAISTTITTTKTYNRILVEYMMNHRSDQGVGNTWSLIYHRILVSGTYALNPFTNPTNTPLGNPSQVTVMSSGHMGAHVNHIGFYERTFIWDPLAQGTFTFTASILAHQGTCFFGSGNNGATSQYLRLYEIGSA